MPAAQTTVLLVAKRIRELRKRRAMSQQELAEAAGTSSHYVSEIERALKNLSVATLHRLVRVGLDLSLSEFFFGVDRPRPAEVERVEQLLAGRPPRVQERILRAITLLLESDESMDPRTARSDRRKRLAR